VDNPATALSAIDGQPDVYAYEFLYGANNPPPGYNAWPYPYNVILGASHALELSFFWGNYWFFGYENYIFREDNRLGWEALTDAMMAYAAEFARTGHPGDAGGVEWFPWSNGEGEAKRILLDANDTETIIEMSTE
jgi:carboxylesterase type B